MDKQQKVGILSVPSRTAPHRTAPSSYPTAVSMRHEPNRLDIRILTRDGVGFGVFIDIVHPRSHAPLHHATPHYATSLITSPTSPTANTHSPFPSFPCHTSLRLNSIPPAQIESHVSHSDFLSFLIAQSTLFPSPVTSPHDYACTQYIPPMTGLILIYSYLLSLALFFCRGLFPFHS
jgi:hypothetical protein